MSSPKIMIVLNIYSINNTVNIYFNLILLNQFIAKFLATIMFIIFDVLNGNEIPKRIKMINEHIIILETILD